MGRRGYEQRDWLSPSDAFASKREDKQYSVQVDAIDRQVRFAVAGAQKIVKAIKTSGTRTDVSNEREATTEDIGAAMKLRAGLLEMGRAFNGEGAPVKKEEVEEKSEEEIRLERVGNLKKDPASQMRLIVDIELTETDWRQKATLNPLAKILEQFLAEHIKTLDKTKKLLNTLIKGDNMKTGDPEAVDLLIEQMKNQHAENRNGAELFKIVPRVKKGKKRKAIVV